MSSAVIPMSTIVVSWRCSRIEPRRDIVPECSIAPRSDRAPGRCPRRSRRAHAPALRKTLRADGGEPRIVGETCRREVAQATARGTVACQLGEPAEQNELVGCGSTPAAVEVEL